MEQENIIDIEPVVEELITHIESTVDTFLETPVIETPIIETPIIETPIVETGVNLDNEEKLEISTAMDLLKKKFVYIKKEQIDQVKNLMRKRKKKRKRKKTKRKKKKRKTFMKWILTLMEQVLRGEQIRDVWEMVVINMFVNLLQKRVKTVQKFIS